MEVLHAVMATGNLTKAAQKLGISQPAVSRMVRHMEDRLGFALFLRENGRLFPTSESTALHQEIKYVFANVQDVQRLSNALRKGAGRIIKVGVVPSLAGFLTEPIRDGLSAHPDIKLVVKIMEPRLIERYLIDASYHLGLVYSIEREQAFSAVEFGKTGYVCIMRKDHRLARRKVIRPKDLRGINLISASDMTPAGEMLNAYFQSAGVERKVVVQHNFSSQACALVEAGVGVALTDPFAIGQAPADALVFRRFDPLLHLKPQMIYSRGRVLSQFERTLIDRLKIASRERLKDLEARLSRSASMRVS